MAPLRVNYLYFGLFFALLALTAAGSVFAKENLSGSRIFFFLYAIGQAALEVSLLVLLSGLIRRFLGKWSFFLFIGGTFVFLILHLFDFVLDRILDLSVWETISFVLDESFDNFLYLLDASGVPLWTWLVAFSLIALLPLIGILLYRAMETIANRKPFNLRYERITQFFFCLFAALLFWDFSASRILHPDAYTAFTQSLPWKWTFLQPKTARLDLPGPLLQPPEEKSIAQAIAQNGRALAQRPNIYLFVVESLREDCITPEGAPYLFAFQKQAVHFDLSLSNGNGSHISWFSIFHSQFPYFWSQLQKKNWAMGSPPLSLLKKWGYKVRLYTSAQLNYYGMEELLFGKNHSLLDSYQTFHHISPTAACETDAMALAALQKDLAENPSLRQGQICIVFWDSTHFDYSWPKNWTPKFIPFAKEFAYFKAFSSQKNIELIKNRYRNAVHYMDSLFGKFLEQLPDREEAIVLFTGDHGEEFFDHGHLFHGSHLTHEQTHVPLYLKFGSVKPSHIPRLACQMDIFPSVIDHLSGNVPSFLEGQSIFRETKWPYAVISRFNASRNPYEFCLHNGQHKLIARFLNRRDIFQANGLQICSLRTKEDKTLPEKRKQQIEQWIHTEFNPALQRLFP